MRSSSWSFGGKIDCRFGFGLLIFGVSGTLFGVSSQLSLGVRAVMSGGNPEVFFLVCTWVESSIKSSSSLVWSSELSPEKLLLPIDSEEESSSLGLNLMKAADCFSDSKLVIDTFLLDPWWLVLSLDRWSTCASYP